jgi:hypothetical protein
LKCLNKRPEGTRALPPEMDPEVEEDEDEPLFVEALKDDFVF